MKLKRVLTRILAMPMAFGTRSDCGNNAATNTPDTTTAPAGATEPSQPGEEGKSLKILTLGHSLAVDSCHMLARIAVAEGYKNFKMGILYYSGCTLAQHVEFLSRNAPDYKLYLSSTGDSNSVPIITDGVTMEQALRHDYWDIIIMQGTSFEIGTNSKSIGDNIKIIQSYVREKCLNPNVKLAWHMGWVPATDNALRDAYTKSENNPYYAGYAPYGDDRATLYNRIAGYVQKNIITDENFQFVIPTATAMENALSSYLEERDIYRDYVHANDFTRVMNAYVWFCKLFGIEQLQEVKMDTIPVAFFKSTQGYQDCVLTDAEKDLILESVNNALKTPFTMTQSQYTTAP